MIFVGQRGFNSYVPCADVAAGVAYLLTKQTGAPLRWKFGELDTVHHAGIFAWVFLVGTTAGQACRSAVYVDESARAAIWEALQRDADERQARKRTRYTPGQGKRTVSTAAGRVSLRQYVAGIKVAIANPDAQFLQTLCSEFGGTGQRIRAEFLSGVHDRINAHIPRYGIGRNWKQEQQHELRHAANCLNTPRQVVDWLPLSLRQRFADRLRCNNLD